MAHRACLRYPCYFELLGILTKDLTTPMNSYYFPTL